VGNHRDASARHALNASEFGRFGSACMIYNIHN
jgi:hypothetical protein